MRLNKMKVNTKLNRILLTSAFLELIRTYKEIIQITDGIVEKYIYIRLAVLNRLADILQPANDFVQRFSLFVTFFHKVRFRITQRSYCKNKLIFFEGKRLS